MTVIAIKAEHEQELRVRLSMIEHELVLTQALEHSLLHEKDIERQLDVLYDTLLKRSYDTEYPLDFKNRAQTVRRQKERSSSVEYQVTFYRERVEALQEALTFFLFEEYTLSPAQNWHFDLDNMQLTLEE